MDDERRIAVKNSVGAMVLVTLIAGCASLDSTDVGGATETTVIRVPTEDQGIVTISRPIGCAAPAGSATDLDSEPPHWLVYGEYMRWYDGAGCPVRIDVISHIRGAEHCGWQAAEFITIGRPLGTSIDEQPHEDVGRYVWNPGVIPGEAIGVTVPTEALPDAYDTGYRQGDRELWLDSGDDTVLYIVTGDIARELTYDLFTGLCA